MASIGDFFVTIKADAKSALSAFGALKRSGVQAGGETESAFLRANNSITGLGGSLKTARKLLAGLGIFTLVRGVDSLVQSSERFLDTLNKIKVASSESIRQVRNRITEQQNAFFGNPVTSAQEKSRLRLVQRLRDLGQRTDQIAAATQGGPAGIGAGFSGLGKSAIKLIGAGLRLTPGLRQIGRDFAESVTLTPAERQSLPGFIPGSDARAIEKNLARARGIARGERAQLIQEGTQDFAIQTRLATEKVVPILQAQRIDDQMQRAADAITRAANQGLVPKVTVPFGVTP